MRSYCKVFSPLDESWVSATRANADDRIVAMRSHSLGYHRKQQWIDNFNFFAGFGVPNQNALVWYQIDTTTGTPPGGGVIVSQWNGIALARGLYPLYPYSEHPEN